jgi:dipeptidyl aminopeptidase/acylaminoacyl peptidase
MNFVSDYAQNDLTPYWQQEFIGGSPYRDPAPYIERSPVFHAGRIRVPVLFVHGAEDIRVPPAQSREMVTALQENGVPVEFVLYPREGHGVEEPAHQIDFMKRQLEWLERYTRPESPIPGGRRGAAGDLSTPTGH